MSAKLEVRVSRLFWLIFLLTIYFLPAPITAQTNEFSEPCAFNTAQNQFAGTPTEQARCLLRPVGIQGKLGESLKKLPAPLEKLVGQPFKLKKAKLREYLKARQLDEMSLGGSLDAKLSIAKTPTGELVQAVYFVIHDTSDPYLKDAPFPTEINDQDWSGNKLEKWLKLPVAHVFINRAGESMTTTDFGETIKKGWGTKFARDVLKADAKGSQLHIELVQPRRRDPHREPRETNDAVAPQPGFSEKQYERLALVYLCAAARRGSWLIPAFHAAVDAGIKDAHDDPQNFELKIWADKLVQIIKQIQR